jgi:hypothetical protein
VKGSGWDVEEAKQEGEIWEVERLVLQIQKTV